MAIATSQILFEAIPKIEADLALPEMAGSSLRKEIVALLDHMKRVQKKLDDELTEMDDGDEQ
jgi:hypothetical protein